MRENENGLCEHISFGMNTMCCYNELQVILVSLGNFGDIAFSAVFQNYDQSVLTEAALI